MIPVKPAKPGALELSWEPGPIAGSRFTDDEMARITATGTPAAVKAAFGQFAPGWTIAFCGTDMEPGLRAVELGRPNVFLTHPLDRETACVLSRKVEIPAGRKTTLDLTVGHHPDGDWDLVVRADMRELLAQAIGKHTATNGWRDVSIDLTAYAGKTVLLELVNKPTGWSWEAGYWARIALTTQ